MRMQVAKWGNSLAVRIPRGFAAEAGLEEGVEVEMTVDEGEIRVRRAPGPEYRLDALLRGVRPDNLHGEVDAGGSVGREAW